MLYNRLTPIAERLIGEYQCGFRANRSTIDQIFTLRQMCEKAWEFVVTIWHLFIDFKAAYDSVHRKFLYRAMTEMGFPNKLIRLTRMTMQRTQGRVKANGQVSFLSP